MVLSSIGQDNRFSSYKGRVRFPLASPNIWRIVIIGSRGVLKTLECKSFLGSSPRCAAKYVDYSYGVRAVCKTVYIGFKSQSPLHGEVTLMVRERFAKPSVVVRCVRSSRTFSANIYPQCNGSTTASKTVGQSSSLWGYAIVANSKFTQSRQADKSLNWKFNIRWFESILN